MLTNHRGFILLTIVAILAIVAVLGAVAMPTLAGYGSFQRAVTAETMLNSLELSLSNPTGTKSGFFQLEGVYPSHLSMLNVAITGSEKKCATSQTFTNKQVTNWAQGAPFSGLLIVPWTSSGSGVRTPIGVVRDSVYKVSSSQLAMEIDSVDTEDARNLDFLVDGGTIDSTTGLDQWGPATGITAGTPLHLVSVLFTNSGC